MTIFFVEGNIGTGKSTLLSQIKKHDTAGRYQVIYEPVDIWTSFTDSTGSNILEYFYKDTKRYAYAFQNLAFISRIEKIDEIDYTKEHVFIERSVWSDSNVFARNCYEQGTLSEIEYLLYKRWFDWTTKNTNLPVDYKHIYLRCSPELSSSRMQKRGRKEEDGVSLEYTKQIHNQHERWLKSLDGVIHVDASVDFTNDEIFNELFEKILEKK